MTPEVLHAPSHRAVLIADSGQAAQVVPSGRSVRYKGKEYTAFDHTYDTALALRSAGYAVDSPIAHGDFDFQGRFTPYAHQRVTASFLSMYPRAFCFSQLGTGKTASCVWAAEYLRRLGIIRRILVLCPMNLLRNVWEPEIHNCAPGVECEVLRGSAQACRTMIQGNAPWLLLNHDGIKTRFDDLMAQDDIDLVICDESTAFKTPGADRTKAFVRLVRHNEKRLWCLTGTPMAKLPTDVYTTARLVCPHRVPKSFSLFEDMTCLRIGTHRLVPKRGAQDIVMDLLDPVICYQKRECIDLPSVTYMDMQVDVNPEQTRIIKQLQAQFVAEVRGQKVTALTAATQLTKILQVLQGAVILDTESGKGDIIGAPQRLKMTEELIEESSSKTIIFAPFKLSVQYLMRELGPKYGADYVDGTVPEGRRKLVFDRFREDPSMRVLIAHPRTTSHGLTLVSASTIIWYGPVFSAEEYLQGCGRIDRPGQMHAMSIYNLFAHPAERKFYGVLKERISVQDKLLSLVAEF